MEMAMRGHRARSPSSARSPSPTSPRSRTSARSTSSCSGRSRRSSRPRRRSCAGLRRGWPGGGPGRRGGARSRTCATTSRTITFGPGGDVFAATRVGRRRARRRHGSGRPPARRDFEFPFAEAHNLTNALCAVAIGVALGCDPAEMARRTSRIDFSRLRGERVALPRADRAAQRLLQRQSDLDARSAREPRDDRRPRRRARARSRSSAGWPSSAPTAPTTTARSAPRPASSGSDR